MTLVYRSPNSSNENNDKLNDLLKQTEKNSFIIGDFNYPHIDWNLHIGGDIKSRNFIDVVEDRFLHQIIDFPTHERGKILDIALVNDPSKIISAQPIGNLGNSDHSIIVIEILFEGIQGKTCEQIPDWNKADEDGFHQYLQSVDWKEKIDDRTTDEAWLSFKGILHEGICQFVPSKPRRVNNKPLWSNRHIARLSRLKQRRWNANLSNPSPENYEKYKKAEVDCKKAVRNAKRKFEKKLSNSGNQRPFHAYVRSKTKFRTNVGPLKVAGKLVSNSADMADILNKFFSSVFTNENTNNVPVEPTLPSRAILENMNFTKDGVEVKINKLKPSTAPGPDGITARILQTFKTQLSGPLSNIFNKSFQSGSVPKDWRIGNVTPIFKKGVKGDPGNYRPVSLTSIPCKLMESLMKDIIVDHLIENQLIKDSQLGFMSTKSCLTNLLEFLEKITAEFDQGNPMDIIYLDFSKAFDKVPKNRLLSKLRTHSIAGKLVNWFESWLTDREQRVVLDGSASTWAKVLSGVPQGSVLGPLAFIIFINNIDEMATLVSIVLKFADDTKLVQRMTTEADRANLQQCLENLCIWADTWGMEFNVKKCKVLHTGRNNPRNVYYMNGHQLEVISEEKDLGVFVQDNLKPTKQCSEAARIANFKLGEITRAFHYRDKKTFLSLYKQFVRPHLEYITPAWSPWLAGDIERLEKVQKRAVKQISGLNPGTYSDKLKELNLESLEDRRVRADMIATFKIMKNFNDVNPETWFKQVGNDPTRVTRQSSHPMNLEHRIARTEIRRNSFSVRVPIKWNNLPDYVKDSTKVSIFKKNYDKHMCRENIADINRLN